ncbi:MAG TPA: NAD(P)-dependent oxidoreductase [Vicinamibacterales bacterium]|jgi:3-hydroxyisobutyrate dehydrogenase-like beta-hydroxyacid dehydrogenase|nr:NAD(P)-dependent oxidoreductase [Vicinamibacterales bacterium]
MKVGFIGLGRMGSGMASRILSGGHDLAIFDAVAAQMEPLVNAGARAAASVADVCRDRDVVITMLVEDATVIDVALGTSGLCDSLSAEAIHLLMGTHGVATVRALEARHHAKGQHLVAAPVLGRPDLAATGQLGIVAAGADAAMGRVQPLLNVMGRRTFLAGSKPESATAIKLANNAVLGCAMVAMAEGFALVRKYGVVAQVFQDVMTEGLFSAPAYKVYGQKMVDESFDQVGSPIHVGLKDANLIAAAADLARVPMPSHNVYRDRLLGAVAHGDGDRDQAVLAREQARASGLA